MSVSRPLRLTAGRREGTDSVLDLPLPERSTAPLSRRGRDYRTRRLLVIADVSALMVAAAAFNLAGGYRGARHVVWLLPTIPVWLCLFYVYGLYSSGLRRVGHSTIDDIPGL